MASPEATPRFTPAAWVTMEGQMERFPYGLGNFTVQTSSHDLSYKMKSDTENYPKKHVHKIEVCSLQDEQACSDPMLAWLRCFQWLSMSSLALVTPHLK